MNLHFVTSLINSGLVTIATSLAMTYKNADSPHFLLWVTNWLVSWIIVCAFVYYLAPKIAAILKQYL